MPAARPLTPEERPTTLWLNDQHLLTVQTTPRWLDDWALGFLFSEGVIEGADAVRSVQVALGLGNAPAVWVEAALSPRWKPAMARRRYITSGCGKGVTFSSVRDALTLTPVAHQLQVAPGRLVQWQRRFEEGAELYRMTRGLHGAAVAHVDRDEVLVREDIGRHNAVDKAIGAALRKGWDTGRCVLLTSGRISYEMCAKLARAGIAVGASRTAATDQAVRLAERLGIALVGYLCPERMVLYTDPAGRITESGYASSAFREAL